MFKTCADCKEFLPLSSFYKVKAYRGGYHTACKNCCYIRNEKSRAKRAEDVKLKAKIFRDKPEYKEKARQSSRKFRKENPDKNQENKRIHRAKKYGNGGRHTEAEWQEVLRRTNNSCARCGSKLQITRDHIIPISVGGTDNITNIQPLCQSCNSQKGNRSSENYLRNY